MSAPAPAVASLATQTRSAVLWRSGSQIVAQIVAWSSTFLVIRLLDPADYGLFAMTQVVLVLLNLLNGYGLASALVQGDAVGRREVAQLFGMLLLLNATLALAQFASAPLVAGYFHDPAVAPLLRVQSLLYLATPFIALPMAMLSRQMDFRHQARANIVSSVAGALTALGGAWAGLGVWTLVAAPMALFGVRAVVMTRAIWPLPMPSFDFRGAGSILRFGGAMATTQFFWFAQSQSDVFIAGRVLDAHRLGLYTTALFLAQIFVGKFVPPLNEVAFSAYSRMRGQEEVADAFLAGARLVMAAALPFYLGMLVAAEPLVAVALGAKWMETVPIVRLLACAMPLMTLQILFAPATDARGRPGIGAGNSAIGAVLLPSAFLIGIAWGTTGLATAFVAAYPVYLAITMMRSLPVIGVRAAAIGRTIAPALLAAGAMALAVWVVDGRIADWAPLPRLGILLLTGAASYALLLAAVARETMRAIVRAVRGKLE